MTTTVRILIEGNKAVNIALKNPDGTVVHTLDGLLPFNYGTMNVSGEQSIEIKEIGEFVS